MPHSYRILYSTMCLLLLLALSGCGQQFEMPVISPTLSGSPTATAAPSSTPEPTMPATLPTARAIPPAQAGMARVLYTRSDAAQGHGEIWSVNIDGTQDHLLLSAPAHASIEGLVVAAGGDLLLYTAIFREQPSELHVASTNGSADRMLLKGEDPSRSYVFSPDSRFLAFVRTRSVDPAGEESAIWLVEIATGMVRQLSDWGQVRGQPFWADNEHVLFSQNDAIWSAALHGTDPPQQLFQGRLAAISADRTKLLIWLEPHDSDMSIAYEQPSRFGIASLMRGKVSLISELSFPPRRLAWSPNTQFIALDQGQSISIVSQHGSIALEKSYRPAEQLPKGAIPDGPAGGIAWLPDSSGIVFPLGKQSQSPAMITLQRLNRDGSEQTLSSFPWTGSVYFAISHEQQKDALVTKRVIGLVPIDSSFHITPLQIDGKIHATQPFTVTVNSYGSSSCTRPDGASVAMTNMLAIITPYDLLPIEGACTADLAPHPRLVTLSFSQAGSATIRVQGLNFADEIVSYERTVTVLP